MKNLFLIILIVLFIYSINSYSQVVWEQISTPSNQNFYDIIVDDNGVIYLGCKKINDTGGVIRSSNDGASWSFMGLEDHTVVKLAFNHADNLLAGISIFPGLQLYDFTLEEWERVYSSVAGVVSLELGYDNVVFAGSSYIMRSYDDGYTWEELSSLDNSSPLDIAVRSEDTIYVATTKFLGGGGVYRTIDGGDNWQNIGLENHYVASLGLNAQGDLFAGCIGQHLYGYGGLYKLAVGSESWDTLLFYPFIRSIVISQENDIFCGYWEESEASGGILHSNDGGESWSVDTLGIGDQGVLRLFLDRNETLYALTAYSSKLYKSTSPVSIGGNTNYIERKNSLCAPNPFFDKTIITFEKPEKTNTKLSLYLYSIDGACELNRCINIEEINQQSIIIERNNFSPGIYSYLLFGSNYYSSGKILITNK